VLAYLQGYACKYSMRGSQSLVVTGYFHKHIDEAVLLQSCCYWNGYFLSIAGIPALGQISYFYASGWLYRKMLLFERMERRGRGVHRIV